MTLLSVQKEGKDMSEQVTIGQKVPNFTLPATSETTFNLADYAGKNVIIYFYPKDSTPGCTTQGMQFRDHYDAFKALNTEIVGVSRDTLKSHEKFKEKFTFPFELIADTEEEACLLFDVMKLKNMYGKQVRGIQRSTFIIDTNGVLIHEWRKVKVNGHVDEVLSFMQNQ
jgi:peroxiredoxin Q/BCP